MHVCRLIFCVLTLFLLSQGVQRTGKPREHEDIREIENVLKKSGNFWKTVKVKEKSGKNQSYKPNFIKFLIYFRLLRMPESCSKSSQAQIIGLGRLGASHGIFWVREAGHPVLSAQRRLLAVTDQKQGGGLVWEIW